MIAAIYARSSTAAFCCLLALATAVSADGACRAGFHQALCALAAGDSGRCRANVVESSGVPSPSGDSWDGSDRRKESPLPRQPPNGVCPPIREGDAGAGHQLLDGAGH